MKEYLNILKTKDDRPFMSSLKGSDFSGFNYVKRNKKGDIL